MLGSGSIIIQVKFYVLLEGGYAFSGSFKRSKGKLDHGNSFKLSIESSRMISRLLKTAGKDREDRASPSNLL